MEVSKITFTRETKDKIKRGMSAHEKGKVLYGRLTEAAENGMLAQCKTRREIAEMMGYTGEGLSHRGYSWVNNLIRRQHISEVAIAPGEYQYFLGPKKPDYDYKGVAAAKANRKAKTETTTLIRPEEVIYEKTQAAKITLRKENKTIEIEGDKELVKEVIKMFMED